MRGISEPLKECPRCRQQKSFAEYGTNSTRGDGLAYYCKECCRGIAKQHYRRRRMVMGKSVRDRVPPPEGHKWCPDCAEYRSVQDFPRNRASYDGLNSYCKTHHNIRGKNTHFSRMYGMSAEQVGEMIEEQGGLCRICQRLLGDKPHVDHAHETGQVRGILCFNCNGGLGQFGDDIARLQQAVEYLMGNLQPSAQAAAQAEQRLVDLICRLGRAA